MRPAWYMLRQRICALLGHPGPWEPVGVSWLGGNTYGVSERHRRCGLTIGVVRR